MSEDTLQGKRMVRPPVWLVGLLLGGAVLALYSQATKLGFINFDDDDYVINNPHVQRGLTLEGVSWALTSLEQVNWHPLTWISLELDTQLFGREPAGYHRTNVLLHAANTLLLFWLLQKMTGAPWRSALVAAFFGLHPVHVEAVAWVTARKDVLSTFFGLLAMAAYLGYARRPSIGRYALVAAPFALSLMAKQMLVTLPAVLLLLDYWPLKRWPAELSATASTYQRASSRWLLLEKLPLLALAIPACWLTLAAQAPIIHSLADYTLYDRVSNALVSYGQYLRMAIWPTDLAILYPLPRRLPLAQPLAAFGLLSTLTVGLLGFGRRRRYLAVGWLWFLGTLVPVIGIVQNGPQAMADRYAYVPFIGLYIIVVWGVADACSCERRRRAAVVAAGAALVGCFVVSWRQFDYWQGSEALWRHALAATTDNAGAHTMLAKTLLDQREYPEAIEQFEASLKLEADNVANLGNIAVALTMLGQLDRAAAYLERSLRIRPNHAFTHFNLGSVYERQERFAEALKQYEAALELDPDLTQAGVNRASLLARQGDFALARRQLDSLLARSPQSAALHAELGRLYRQQHRFVEAIACYDRALELQPDSDEAWNGKGFALESLGRFAEAANCYRQAVSRRPQELLYRLNLASAQLACGDDAAADEQFRAAFELQPGWALAALAEAWTRATHPNAGRRDGTLALRSATLVCKASNDRMPQAIDVQAAAYAELGQFDRARDRQSKVLSMLGPGAPPALRNELAGRLHLYERNQPYRQPLTAAP